MSGMSGLRMMNLDFILLLFYFILFYIEKEQKRQKHDMVTDQVMEKKV